MTVDAKKLTAVALIAAGIVILFWQVVRPPGRRLDRRRQLLPRLPDPSDRALLRLGAPREAGRDARSSRPGSAWSCSPAASGAARRAPRIGAVPRRVSLIGPLAGIVLFLFGWAHLRILAFPIAFLLLMIPIPAIIFNRSRSRCSCSRRASASGRSRRRTSRCCARATCSMLAQHDARSRRGVQRHPLARLAASRSGIVYGYFTDPRAWVRTLIVLSSDSGRDPRQRRARRRHGHRGALDRPGGRRGLLPRVLRLDRLHRRVRDDSRHSAPHHVASRAALPVRRNRPAALRTGGDIEIPCGHASSILLVCLLAAAVVVARADRPEEMPPRGRRFRSVPDAARRLAAAMQQPPFTDHVLEVLGLDDYLTRAYFTPDPIAGVDLYIGYWKSQRQGDTIHSPQNCLPGAAGSRCRKRILDVPDPRTARRAAVARQPLRDPEGPRPAARSLLVPEPRPRRRQRVLEQVLSGADAVRFNRTDGAIVRVIAPVAGNSARGRGRRPNARSLRFVNGSAAAARRVSSPLRLFMSVATFRRVPRCALSRRPAAAACSRKPIADEHLEEGQRATSPRSRVPEAISRIPTALQADAKRGDIRV